MSTVPKRTDKAVYVLGAGFSKPAGAPSQAEILGDIFDGNDSNPQSDIALAALREFLTADLGLGAEEIKSAALEDIYTPMDRCIADGVSFKSRSSAQLVMLREQLGYLISHAIASRISRHQNSHSGAGAYIRQFADFIVEKASHRARLAADTDSSAAAKAYDPLSIVSLNWDILLDNNLQRALEQHDPRTGDYDPFGVVDYCCYISSLDTDNSRIRSGLWTLGCRGYNVKLLKLHGSMNWLQCPNCQRLFVDFGLKHRIIDHIGETLCRHCLKCGHENRLQGSLVMPTFLKDLSNFQIKLVWQNAGVELMEAKRLVFIGYSLPYADFEFRQLLSRMVSRDAVIDVVLYAGTAEAPNPQYAGEVARYRQFFGKRELNVIPEGVVEYVKTRASVRS